MDRSRVAVWVVAGAAAVSWLWAAVPARAAYEPFNYTVGSALVGRTNQTGEYWTAAGSGSSQVTVVSGNLAVTELSPATGASIQFGAVNGPSARFNIGTVTNGTLYFSFLLKVTSLGSLSTTGGFIAGFNNSSGTQSTTPTAIGTRVLTRANGSGGFNLGVAKNSSISTDFVWSSASFTVNQTIFLVGSYTFNSGTDDDVCQLWINPSPYDFSSANPPPATLIATTGSDITLNQIASFVFFQRGLNNANQPGTAVADELRIGSTWASVVPRDPGFVDANMLTGKFVMGYQAWHSCGTADGSTLNKYVHWSHSDLPPSTGDMVDDIWPDLSEFGSDELFATVAGLNLGNGQPAKVYSCYKSKTVNRHFQWMRDYGIDGVMLQRFIKDVKLDINYASLRNTNLVNVRAAAETYGRVFCVEYDMSNDDPSVVISHLQGDWADLTGTLKITNSTRYLRHKGKPVVAVWGLGFTGVSVTPANAQTIINNFKAAGCTVVGGVPYWWRTLNNDSQTDPAWLTVYHSFDVINPWAVGRYSTLSQANSVQNSVQPADLADLTAHNQDYLPVIFPGYSAANLGGTASNSIPRLGGRFYWRQACNTVSNGCNMAFGAMFDEIDEGTATYKLAPTLATSPVHQNIFALNIDGEPIPNDWYLRVAGLITRGVRGELSMPALLPISPTNGITLASPNGGEIWTAGAPATITWSTIGVVGNLRIDLSTDGGLSWRALVANAQNTGAKTVTVPYYASSNCRVRIQMPEGRPTAWSASTFTIQATNVDLSLHADPLWSLATGSRTYLAASGSTERGLAYDPGADELFVVSRNGGLSVNVLDGATGAHLRTLNTTGVGGGNFALNKIGVADDGAIYGANVTVAAGAGNPVRIYRWADSASTTVPTLAYSGAAAFTTGPRVGDTFDIRGGGTNTQILLGSRGDNKASLLTTDDGTTFTPRLLTTDLALNQVGLALAFGGGNTFWAKTNGYPLTYSTFNLTTGSATTSYSWSTNDFPDTTGVLGVDPINNLLAALAVTEGPDQLNLFSISNLSAAPVLLSSWNFPSDNDNPYACGAVAFGGNRLYALDANNGILAFSIAPVFAPRLAAARFGPNLVVSWTNLVPGYVLETAPALPPSGSWQSVSQAVDNVGGQFVVTNNASAASGLYRLRKP